MLTQGQGKQNSQNSRPAWLLDSSTKGTTCLGSHACTLVIERYFCIDICCVVLANSVFKCYFRNLEIISNGSSGDSLLRWGGVRLLYPRRLVALLAPPPFLF